MAYAACRAPPTAHPPVGRLGCGGVQRGHNEVTMAANAKVIGELAYRAGDGPLLTIPRGPVEVQVAEDSAVLSWGDQGEAQSTAIPIDEYRRYVREGVIESTN